MKTAVIYSEDQGREVMSKAWAWCKTLLATGRRVELQIGEQTRNNEQNKLLHATITDIAKRREWAGKKRSVEVWKRLLTAAWLRARGESVEVLPALDGHGIDVVFRHTSKLTKAECAELIDFVTAWDAQQ